jgi:hypothetical protein
MRRVLGFSLPLLLFVALAAAGCGGGDDSGQDTAKLLRDTFGRKQPVESGKLDLGVSVDAAGIAGLPSPLRIGLEGPFDGSDRAKPKFDFDLTVGTRDGEVTLGAISTGGKSWLTVAGRAFALPGSAFAGLTKGDPKTGAPPVDLSTFGVDPRRWLRDVHEVGTEDVAGERVIHLRGDVDKEPLIADLDKLLGRAGSVSGAASGITDAQREQLVDAVSGADVDIWTGEKDHKLRRITVDVHLDEPSGGDGTIKLDLGVSQIDREQAIGPPANPRPIAELTSALAKLAAARGAQSGSGASGGATGETGSPGSGGSQGSRGSQGSTGGEGALPENTSEYDRCLAAAGSDLAAAQKCADLVGR